MSTVEYEWRERFRVSIDPNAVGAEIAAIVEETGGILPAQLVERARPVTSPIHKAFEWNDAIAANAQREDQASRLIRWIRVKRTDAETDAEPAFVTLRRHSTADDDVDHSIGYQSLNEVRTDPVKRSVLIRQELSQIKGLLDRTAWVEEFKPLRDAMAVVLDRLLLDARREREKKTAA